MAKKLSDAESSLRTKKFAVRVLAYAAGIIDGEGTIGAWISPSHGSISMHVSVGMTDKMIPEWFLQQFGGSLRCNTTGKPQHKPCWVWNAFTSDQLPLCRLLIPFLKLKQRQARLLMVIRTGMLRKRPLSKQQRAIDEMKHLNAKGNPLSPEAIREPKTSDDMVPIP